MFTKSPLVDTPLSCTEVAYSDINKSCSYLHWFKVVDITKACLALLLEGTISGYLSNLLCAISALHEAEEWEEMHTLVLLAIGDSDGVLCQLCPDTSYIVKSICAFSLLYKLHNLWTESKSSTTATVSSLSAEIAEQMLTILLSEEHATLSLLGTSEKLLQASLRASQLEETANAHSKRAQQTSCSTSESIAQELTKTSTQIQDLRQRLRYPFPDTQKSAAILREVCLSFQLLSVVEKVDAWNAQFLPKSAGLSTTPQSTSQDSLPAVIPSYDSGEKSIVQ